MFCSHCFFFKQKTAYEMRISDWSSDVCSSDLLTFVIHARDVRKQYPGAQHAALSGLAFDVPAGSVFGLLGPNGAGKTTLMAVLTGVLHADAGSLQIAGHEIPKRMEAVRSLLGFAPQELAFYPTLSVAENLQLFSRLTPAATRDTLDQAIATADLPAHLHKPAEALSGGPKTRLNFAFALLGRPNLTLLDEPPAAVAPHTPPFFP